MQTNPGSLETEINRYRLLILNGIMAFVVWGYLFQAFQPDAWNPMWIRYSAALGFLGLLLVSFRISQKQFFLEWVLIAYSWTVLAHSFWMAWTSNLSYLAFCNSLVWICCLLNVLPTQKSSWYFAFAAGFMGLMVLSDRLWQVHPIIVNVALWSSIVPSLAANYTRIRNRHHLLLVQREMDALFQNMKEGLIVHRPDGSIKTCNPAAKKILGLNEEDIAKFSSLNPTWEVMREKGDRYPADDFPTAVAFRESREVQDKIMGVRRGDGGIAWIKVTASPFLANEYDSQQSVLVTFSDIGEVKKSQKIIFEQQSRIEASARLTALGEMAAGVAHEINNPLAIISGKVFNILKNLNNQKSSEPIDVSLQKIQATVERMQKIVKGLQTFSSGGEQDPFERVQLVPLIEDAISYCQEKIETRKIQIVLDLEQDLVFDCRPYQISQVVVNLVMNSCDAIEHLPERWIRVWARSAHNTLVLTISDSGAGIPEDLQKKLMQPFFTTKEVGKGTGLGLSITKGLIGSHLGKIWLDTSAKNTTFVIQLPLFQETQKLAA